MPGPRNRRKPGLAHGLDATVQTRNFAGGGVSVKDAFADGAHHGRFGFLHGFPGLHLVTGCNRVLNAAQARAHQGTTGFVYSGFARHNTHGFPGGFGVGHIFFSFVTFRIQRAALNEPDRFSKTERGQ